MSRKYINDMGLRSWLCDAGWFGWLLAAGLILCLLLLIPFFVLGPGYLATLAITCVAKGACVVPTFSRYHSFGPVEFFGVSSYVIAVPLACAAFLFSAFVVTMAAEFLPARIRPARPSWRSWWVYLWTIVFLGMDTLLVIYILPESALW